MCAIQVHLGEGSRLTKLDITPRTHKGWVKEHKNPLKKMKMEDRCLFFSTELQFKTKKFNSDL